MAKKENNFHLSPIKAVAWIIIFLALIILYLLTRTPTHYGSITNLTAPNTVITGVDAEINLYDNLTHSYQYETRAFPGKLLPVGSSFADTLFFVNNGTSPLLVESIEPSTQGFTLLNVSPKLPYVMAPGSTLSITTRMASPQQKYVGDLTLSFSETLLDSTPYAEWDRQEGLAFASNWSSLAYNLSIVAQDSAKGCGPAYLLDGLSNTGYWYQVGISYDWCHGSEHDNGFLADYEVFAPNGSSIYPEEGSGQQVFIGGNVSNGNKILLDLYISGGNVILIAKDWNTSAYMRKSFSAEGANTFVSPSPSGNGTFFTGLMMEWYYVNQYYGGVQNVTFAPYCSSPCLPPAWLFSDEFYAVPNQSNVLFFNVTPAPVMPGQNAILNSYGTNESYLKNGSFIIGS